MKFMTKHTHFLLLIPILSVFFLFSLFFFKELHLVFLLLTIYLLVIILSIIFMSLTTLHLKRFPFLSIWACLLSSNLLFLCLNLPLLALLPLVITIPSTLLTTHYLFIYNIFVCLFIVSTFIAFYCFLKPSRSKIICQLYFIVCFVMSGLSQLILLYFPSYNESFSLIHLFYFKNFLLLLSFASMVICLYRWFKYDLKSFSLHWKHSILLALLSYCILFIFDILNYQTLLHHFLSILLIVAMMSIIFYITFTRGFINQFHTFTDRLHIHEKSNILMSKYIESMAKSQEDMVKQYSQIDAMYTQMMLLYPDAFFIIVNDHIAHINGHAEALLELESSNTLLDHHFIDYIAPTSQELVLKLIEDLYNHVIYQDSLEIQMLTPSGKTLEVEAFFTLSKERGDNVFLLSARDISDRKQRAELAHQVEMEKLKVEFFSTISHELKTPVNIIYSAVQLQNNLIASNEAEKACSYNTMISQNCLRLLKLLNNLLDINRIESNYLSSSPQYLNVVAIAENILTSIQPFANRKNISTIFDTELEEIYIHIDPDLFERILLNLLSNSIKYTNMNGHIWVTLSTTPNQVIISVKDDGVGIPDSKLETIFERFVRIDSGLIRHAEGAGIGLSLVKSLVELHNGNVTVHSTLGKGSEFIVTFPLETDTTTHAPMHSYISSIDKVNIEFSDVFI